MSWDLLPYPMCTLTEAGVVAAASPSWSLLAHQVGESPFLWAHGANGLERLRQAASNGDPNSQAITKGLEALLSGRTEPVQQTVSLPSESGPTTFLWTAVTLGPSLKGAVVSVLEQGPSGPSAIASFDAQGRLVEADAAFAELLETTPDSLHNASFWQAIRDKDPRLAAVLQAVVPSTPTSQLEWFWQPDQSKLSVCWFPHAGHTRIVFSRLGRESRPVALSPRLAYSFQERTYEERKMEAIQRLAGGVAHDFNNRLSEILGNAELALSSQDMSQELRAAFESITASARRSANLVRQLLAFARQETIAPRTMDLNRAIGDLLSMRCEMVDERIRLTFTPDPQTPLIKADPSQIHQILAHLVSNAQDAVLQNRGSSGEIRISTRQRIVDEETSRKHGSVSPGVFANIEVTDNGCGLDQELAFKIFEPFFTTKPSGSGMGLSTVQGIVGQNGGFVEVVSHPGKGSSFLVALPSRLSDGEGTPGEVTVSDELGYTKTVLFVDDEPVLLNLGRRRLARMGWKVLSASGPTAALELADSYPGHIDLLLTDVMMPGMNGHELSLKIRDVRPQLQAVFMSGYGAEILTENGILSAGVHFLAKPFSDDELRTVIAQAMSLQAK